MARTQHRYAGTHGVHHQIERPPMVQTEMHSETSAAVAAGVESANIETRLGDVAGVPIALLPEKMRLEVLTKALEEADRRADAPRRRRGVATHDEVQSFIDHVNRFKNADSVIFADVSVPKITAVFNYNPGGGDEKAARWGDHRSLYKCPLSKQWQLWTKKNEQWMSQDEFAEFIDAHISDLANPHAGAISTDIAAPAAIVEMARKLTVIQHGQFQRQVNPTTGETTLINKTEHDTQSTKIHRAFLLGIPVFEAGEPYAVEARVRFALNSGRPQFMYSLFEVERVLRDAFDGVRVKVREATGLPLFAGSPE